MADLLGEASSRHLCGSRPITCADQVSLLYMWLPGNRTPLSVSYSHVGVGNGNSHRGVPQRPRAGMGLSLKEEHFQQQGAGIEAAQEEDQGKLGSELLGLASCLPP